MVTNEQTLRWHFTHWRAHNRRCVSVHPPKPIVCNTVSLSVCVCHYRLLIVVITGLIRELAATAEMHSGPVRSQTHLGRRR